MSHSLKPGRFQLSGKETCLPDIWIINCCFKLLIPVIFLTVAICISGSQKCLLEAKFYLVSRWKSCMPSD